MDRRQFTQALAASAFAVASPAMPLPPGPFIVFGTPCPTRCWRITPPVVSTPEPDVM